MIPHGVRFGAPIALVIGSITNPAISLVPSSTTGEERHDTVRLARRAVDRRAPVRAVAQLDREATPSPLVELYELRIAARSRHAAEPHAPGTHELLVVLSGVLRMHVDDQQHELQAGDSISFAADRVHVYENFGASEARYHNVIIYEHV